MLKTLTTDHWHEVTEPHKHNQNSPWQTLTTVDTVCPFLNLAGKWGWNSFFFENWKIKCFLNFKNLSAEFSVTYFQEVVFLSVEVSVMCQIFSRWLKLNVLLYEKEILTGCNGCLNQSKYYLLIIYSIQIPTQLYQEDVLKQTRINL